MKCAICKKILEENNYYYYGGLEKGFCSEKCFNEFLIKEKENEHRRNLYKTICRIFGISKLDGKLLKEIQRLNENGVSCYNIMGTLHYLYDVKKMKIYSPTLYYVKENLEEARRYYQSISEKQKQVEKIKNIEEEQKQQAKTILPNYDRKKENKMKIDPSTV